MVDKLKTKAEQTVVGDESRLEHNPVPEKKLPETQQNQGERIAPGTVEEILPDKSENLRSLIENSFDGIFICRDGVLKFCSRRFAEIFGFKAPADITGREIKKLVYIETTGPVDEILRGYNNFLAWRKNGVEFEVEILAGPITYCEQPAVQGVLRDLSKVRQLEKQLRQAQKMEVIGTLASGIAHDFNNILSIIMGYLELSLDSRTDEMIMRQNLQQALKASHRAKDLVQQILTFSRRGEKQKGPVQVTPIVKEVIKMMRSSMPAAIEIRQDISEKRYVVLADPIQLHQVIMNLCTNAWHAMQEEGGTLEVVLSDLNRDLEAISEVPLAPSPYMRLTISDTGHGMTAPVKEKIFEPFFTTKKKGEGTGMGLSVVLGIVKHLDGEISVESEPGKGTSFHLFLPLLEEGGAAEEQPAAAVPPKKERVLLVEDELVLRNIARRMLEQLGYEVVAKSNGIDALEVFRQNPADFGLVISDLTMPIMTGIQLAREIIKITARVPIIICTGFNEVINRENLRDLGMEGLIMKPYSKDKISSAIKTVLD